MTPDDDVPLLRVVRGDPSPEEIAALVAVLVSVGAGTGETAQRADAWSDHARRLGAPAAPAPGAWRASVWPR